MSTKNWLLHFFRYYHGYIMSAEDNKYLVLRGKNKDIYFIQKRLSKNLASIIGKSSSRNL